MFALAGVVQGCTGFGLGLVAAPCLLLVLDPVAMVPTVLLLSTLNTLVVAGDARKHIRFGLVTPMALGGLVGFPIGVYALTAIDADTLKLYTGIFVTLAALALLSGWRLPLRTRMRTLFPVGMVGGFLGGSTSMGGPPVILFLSNQGTPKDTFRASIACYFFLVNTFVLGWLAYSGIITQAIALRAALFLPTMLLGTYLGIRLAGHVPEALFRKAVMIGIALVGVVLLIMQI